MKSIITLLVVVLFSSPSAFAARKKAAAPAGASSAASSDCARNLSTAQSEEVQFVDLFEEFSIDDLLNPDPQKNLAVRFPTTLMDSFQKSAFAINTHKPRTILDPTYRVSKVLYWPVFHDGLAEASGLQIVGQFEVVNKLVQHIENGAQGNLNGLKMLLLRGPAGTGKTETAKIIASLLIQLAQRNRLFEQLTFDWVGLEEVPEFRLLMGADEKGQTIVKIKNTLERSPFVLLTPRQQQQVLAIAGPNAQKLLGMPARPWTTVDPQTARILDTLIKHYAKEQGKNRMSLEEYDAFRLEVLRKHVRIRPKKLDPSQPPPILRFQGKDPELHQLFFAENLPRMSVLGVEDPLSYDYGGRVPRADGGPLLLDDFFRNPSTLRDLFLEIAQNRVIERGGAPALSSDTVLIASSNDASIEEAKQDGGAKAQLDRCTEQPMRAPIHPLEIAKTAVHMMGIQNFEMRKLGSSRIEPAKLNVVFPAPTDDGKLEGTDGRYVLYYKAKDGRKVLIAPHSILMMALTASATRLVTDKDQATQKDQDTIDILKNNDHVFNDATTRLQVLLGELSIERAKATELDRLRDILKEGQEGLGARGVQDWLDDAIRFALEKNEDTVTPAVMDQVFYQDLDKDSFKTSSDIRGRWQDLHNAIKRRFILTRLARDLNAMISGDGSRVEGMYQDLKQEIIALGKDPAATDYETATGEKRPINRERYKQIKKIYLAVNGRELVIGAIKEFHVEHSGNDEKFLPLVRAIEQYLLETQLNTTVLDRLYDVLTGKGSDPEGARMLEEVERNFERLGYNRSSFMEALRFIRDIQRSEKK